MQLGLWRSEPWVLAANSRLLKRVRDLRYRRSTGGHAKRKAYDREYMRHPEHRFRKAVVQAARRIGFAPDYSNFESRFKIWLEAKQEKAKWRSLLERLERITGL